MEEAFFPQKEWIIDAFPENVRRLPGPVPSTRQGCTEFIGRSRIGI